MHCKKFTLYWNLFHFHGKRKPLNKFTHMPHLNLLAQEEEKMSCIKNLFWIGEENLSIKILEHYDLACPFEENEKSSFPSARKFFLRSPSWVCLVFIFLSNKMQYKHFRYRIERLSLTLNDFSWGEWGMGNES